MCPVDCLPAKEHPDRLTAGIDRGIVASRPRARHRGRGQTAHENARESAGWRVSDDDPSSSHEAEDSS